MSKTVSLIPLTVVTTAEGRQVPGPNARSFRVSPREAERLIRLKAAKLADTPVTASFEPPVDDDQDDAEQGRRRTRAQLEKELEGLGLDIDQIEGTGQGGRVVNRDIEEAIAQEQAARAAGQSGVSSGNPSIVD